MLAFENDSSFSERQLDAKHDSKVDIDSKGTESSMIQKGSECESSTKSMQMEHNGKINDQLIAIMGNYNELEKQLQIMNKDKDGANSEVDGCLIQLTETKLEKKDISKSKSLDPLNANQHFKETKNDMALNMQKTTDQLYRDFSKNELNISGQNYE